MRNLTLTEIGFVSGAGEEEPPEKDMEEPEQCKRPSDSIVGDQSNFAQDAIAVYEGAIATVVYIAERVTGAVEGT